MIDQIRNWIRKQRQRTKESIRECLRPLENFCWLKCCVPLIERNTETVKPVIVGPDPTIPNGTVVQFEAYKVRKKLLFKRMGFAKIGMCISIIFLAWLQDWLPAKNRAFWSSGTRVRNFNYTN